MFHETKKQKIMRILLPVLIWLAAGMAAELLGMAASVLTGKIQGSAGFQQILNTAHENGETAMLLFRAAVSAGIFLYLYAGDSRQIGYDIHVQRSLKEGPEFFTEPQLPAYYLLFALLAGAGFSLAGNLILDLAGLAGTSQTGTEDGYQTVLYLLYACMAAPLSEELMLRGLIYRRTRTYMLRVLSVLISASIFALLHFDGPASLYSFFFGILLADMFEWTRGLGFPVAAHMSANVISVLAGLTGFGTLIASHKTVFLVLGLVLLVSGICGMMPALRKKSAAH